MKEIITIINQKGGVGKSTTAHNIGAGLRSLRGQKVLFVDLDPQGNLTATLGASDAEHPVLDALKGLYDVEDCIYKTSYGDVLSACPSMSMAETVLDTIGKEYKLKEILDKVKDRYDYIIVDTPPSLGILTVNALTASTSIVIPALADIFSIHGINQLSHTVSQVKKYCNPSLEVKGIVLTRFSPRTVISRDLADVMKKVAVRLDTKVFNTSIRESVAIRESQCQGMDIFSYSPKSPVCQDYANLISEVVGQ